MTQVFRKFRILLGVFYANMLQYRAEMYLWVLSGIMPFFMMGLWMKVSAGSGYSITPVDFARYYLAVFIVRQVTLVWVVWEFEFHVVQGRLSPYLLQPMNPAWRFVLSHIGERFARFPFLVAMVIIFFLIYPTAVWVPRWYDAVLAVMAMIVAFAVRFIMQYTFAMIAFWAERANRIEDLWFLSYLFLSGFMAPLDVFPPLVRTIALWTPFPYLVYMPAQLLTGRCDPGMIVYGFPVMIAWGSFFLGIWWIAWKRGLRHYSAMGA
jgi:ABC-2 type transport system permease protein